MRTGERVEELHTGVDIRGGLGRQVRSQLGGDGGRCEEGVQVGPRNLVTHLRRGLAASRVGAGRHFGGNCCERLQQNMVSSKSQELCDAAEEDVWSYSTHLNIKFQENEIEQAIPKLPCK